MSGEHRTEGAPATSVSSLWFTQLSSQLKETIRRNGFHPQFLRGLAHWKAYQFFPLILSLAITLLL